MKIDNISLKIIPDSRGEETLEAEMEGEGIKVSSSVPSGKSIGKNEVAVIPPQKALGKISWVLSQIKGQEFATLEQFDGLLNTLDGTPNKQSLGANLILALSMAFTKLLARSGGLEIFELIAKISGTKEKKLPLCFFNLIEGGAHINPAPSGAGLPFQEYLFIPRSGTTPGLIPKTSSPKENLNQVLIFIKTLGEKIHQQFGKLKMGDEGGYTIPSASPEVGLKVLAEVMKEGGWDGNLGLDVAASTFFENGSYKVGDKVMDRDELLSYFSLLTSHFPLLSLEDPYSEEDWEGFAKITQTLGEKVWIVGDDLTCTNTKRIKMAHEKGAINAVIIKPNQIGSVSETIQAANLARSYSFKIIVSHRSGETKDSFIADLAVGLGADGLKSGCPLQAERLVKYQRLIDIEKRLAASV